MSLTGGGCQVKQPDGQAGIARWAVAFGLSEHDVDLTRDRGGKRESGFWRQGGEVGGELAGRIAGEVDGCGEAGG